MLTVSCWKWGKTFRAVHVNVLRLALERRLALEHELVCVTDDGAGLHPAIRVVPMPTTYAHTPRCRRRMEQYAREFESEMGRRILTIDLDVVIVDDLTPILDRDEPIVGWRVGHAGVYSGSFLLHDAGALDEAWQRYREDPNGYPRAAAPRGVGSDQAMINHYLSTQPPIAEWTEADGLVTYYGRGYESKEHLGVGPGHPQLPAGGRIVVLGSADLEVLEQRQFPWVQEHWGALADECEAA
jgi:hypothetical protein